MTDNQHAAEALRYATEANDLNAWTTDERQVLAIVSQTFAQLAVADQLRTYLDSVNPPTAPAGQPVTLEPQLTDADLDVAIHNLASILWNADPGNYNNPARTFSEDYANRQDQYRVMARAALGLNDQPQRKDPRRP